MSWGMAHCTPARETKTAGEKVVIKFYGRGTNCNGPKLTPRRRSAYDDEIASRRSGVNMRYAFLLLTLSSIGCGRSGELAGSGGNTTTADLSAPTSPGDGGPIGGGDMSPLTLCKQNSDCPMGEQCVFGVCL